MEAIERTELARLGTAREVEHAYRCQADLAVRRYNTAAGIDPHSPESESAWKLRKEALSQWEKARKDLEAARQAWKLAVSMAAARRRAAL